MRNIALYVKQRRCVNCQQRDNAALLTQKCSLVYCKCNGQPYLPLVACAPVVLRVAAEHHRVPHSLQQSNHIQLSRESNMAAASIKQQWLLPPPTSCGSPKALRVTSVHHGSDMLRGESHPVGVLHRRCRPHGQAAVSLPDGVAVLIHLGRRHLALQADPALDTSDTPEQHWFRRSQRQCEKLPSTHMASTAQCIRC